MRKREKLALLLLASAWWGCGIVTLAQETSQAPSSGPTPAAQAPAPSGDKNKTPAKTAPTADPNRQAPAKKPTTVDDNPFPEDVSKKAAADARAAAKGASAADAPAPGAGKPDSSSSLDGLDKFAVDDSARKRLKLESPDGSMATYDPKRATEDVRVGRFYMQTGYFRGAYARFKDAIDFDHENVDAVFWLAEAARKMNFAQEAEQNYQLYLAAVPDGPNAKTAKKALGELASVRKP